MKRYRIFGGTLASDVALPELRESDEATATWTIRISPEVAARAGRQLGEKDVVGYDATMRLLQLDDGGYRLEYSDTGTFDVSADGRDIQWTPLPTTIEALARVDITSLVLSTALHAAGAIALHASGVVVNGKGIGFCAPKFYGKSTIAMALTYAGALLLTDDTLAIDEGVPPMCIPGVHSVRLRSEAAARFPRTKEVPPPPFPDGRVVDELPPSQLAPARAPLGALYMLTPMNPAPDRPAVVRRLLPTPQAALSILGFAKMGELFRAAHAATTFERATHIAQHTPVYALEIVRDMNRIEEVAETIVRWHEGDA